MRKKEIERKLKRAFAAATPDCLEEMLKECSEKKKEIIGIRTTGTEKRAGSLRRAETRRFGYIAVAALAAVLLLTGAVAGMIGKWNLRAESRAAAQVEKAQESRDADVRDVSPTPMPAAALSPAPADTAAPAREASPVPLSTSLPAGLKEAVQAAKQDANVPEGAEAEARTAVEDGVRVYKVRFEWDGAAYEYDVRIEDGMIIKGEMERKILPDIEQSQNAVSMVQARIIALEHAGVRESDAVFGEQKNGRENGRACYEIEWRLDSVEYEYEIDMETGTILSWNYELEELKHGGVKTENTAAYIGEENAKKIALKDANAAEERVQFTKCRLDEDDGQIYYEIEFILDGVEYEYDIEALTGTVMGRDIDFEELRTENGTGDIGKEKAKAVALSDAKVSETDARNIKCKKATDDGRTVYEIKFTVNGTEYEYEIDAVTGRILDKDQEESEKSPSKKTSAPDGSKTSNIGAAKAKAIALSDAGINASEANRLKCKLETDRDRKIYEVEFEAGGYEYEYDIDAVTGTILERDKERAD